MTGEWRMSLYAKSDWTFELFQSKLSSFKWVHFSAHTGMQVLFWNKNKNDHQYLMENRTWQKVMKIKSSIFQVWKEEKIIFINTNRERDKKLEMIWRVRVRQSGCEFVTGALGDCKYWYSILQYSDGYNYSFVFTYLLFTHCGLLPHNLLLRDLHLYDVRIYKEKLSFWDPHVAQQSGIQ